MFMIDGMQWDLPCDIARTAEMRSSDISGLMLDRSYFNDVLGTYMQYEVKIVVPFGKEHIYNNLYEILTRPVDGHSFELPYRNEFISITGHIENVKDIYKKVGNQMHWRGIGFTVVSNNPSKIMTLGQVLTLGIAPLPDVVNPPYGTMYRWGTYGWELMEDADEKSY